MKKAEKLFLNGNGCYLGMEKGCFIVRDKSRQIVRKYPLFEENLGEIIVETGNTISVGALSSIAFWEIDLLVLTRKGEPIGYLRSINYDTHAETRIAQYRAYTNSKAIEIIKQIVYAKLKGQNIILNKYGLRQHDLPNLKRKIDNLNSENLAEARGKLRGIEAGKSKYYFQRTLKLLPDWLRPQQRKTFQAYDGGNNLFNLAYTILKWKIHRAILKAKLEAYLGFMHCLQHGKPSLICDFQDLYRYLLDHFLIEYSKNLKQTDFEAKIQQKRGKKGKRIYLKNEKSRKLIEKLYEYFEKNAEIPRIRIGKKQKIETLINEELLLFAKYLRNERRKWIPRIIEKL